MAMRNRCTGLCGFDGSICDLGGRAGNVRRPILRGTAARHGAGDEHLFIHRKWHDSPKCRFALENDGEISWAMRGIIRDKCCKKRETMSIFNPVSPSSISLSVDLLIMPDTSLLSLASVMEPMRGANRVSGQALFRWRLFSVDGAVPDSSSGLPIRVEGAYGQTPRSDLLIVLSSFNVNRYSTSATLALLRRAARNGQVVCGVEAGSWLMARAGLLRGRRATTHWEDLDQFADDHPEIDVCPDRFVIDRRFITTGGAAPALDLMLHLIRSRHGQALALDVASLFIYDQTRPAEAPQPQVSLGALGAREPRLGRAVALMEQTLGDPIRTATIADRIGCSARRLEELFQAHIGTTPLGFYLSLRLGAGRRMLLDGSMGIADIAEATGFSSSSGFARAYRRRYHESPSETRKRADGRTTDVQRL